MTMVCGPLFHVEYPFTQFPQMISMAHRWTQSRLPKALLPRKSVSLQDLPIVMPFQHMDPFLL